jgi:hypothetical protein
MIWRGIGCVCFQADVQAGSIGGRVRQFDVAEFVEASRQGMGRDARLIGLEGLVAANLNEKRSVTAAHGRHN